MSENVLVIDDDEITLEIVSNVLSSLTKGEVMTFSSGSMAKWFIEEEMDKEKNETTHYSLIISDWQMPEVSGLELLKLLRKHDKEIPFLMLTANATVEHVLSAKRAGATDYMTKPFTVESFVDKVKRLFL